MFQRFGGKSEFVFILFFWPQKNTEDDLIFSDTSA